MGMPAIRHRWTPAEVRDLQDESRPWPRYELIEGELLVTPSPGHPHQLVIGELYLLLAPYVERHGLGLTMLSPSDLELREGTITQPDLYIVRAEPGTEGGEMRWPDVPGLLLALEVISPSSVRTDRVVKRDFYMASNVAEYWVVDLDGGLVERWMPDRETPHVERAVLAWRPEGATAALAIDVPVLFGRVREKGLALRNALSPRTRG